MAFILSSNGPPNMAKAQNKEKLSNKTNILDLIKKSRSEKLEEKKHTFTYVTFSILLLLVVLCHLAIPYNLTDFLFFNIYSLR